MIFKELEKGRGGTRDRFRRSIYSEKEETNSVRTFSSHLKMDVKVGEFVPIVSYLKDRQSIFK